MGIVRHLLGIVGILTPLSDHVIPICLGRPVSVRLDGHWHPRLEDELGSASGMTIQCHV